jgi:hypothetical protein
MSDETQPLENREGINWSPGDALPVNRLNPDRSRDVGYALTEVRTVLGVARAALERLRAQGPLEYPPRTGVADLDDYRFRADHKFDDPDLEAMQQNLRIVIGMLRRWERFGPADRSTFM